MHGHVYENRYEWRYKWKICAENEAYSLYVALLGMELATRKRIYGLLKRQVLFSVISLLPLGVALLLLAVAREWTMRVLGTARLWLERHVRTVAAVLVVLLAVALMRNGIAGLT